MTREEKFIELNRLYAELRPIVDRIMVIIDAPASDESAKYTPVKTERKKRGKKMGRSGKEKNYKCRDCGNEFASTLKKLDITCNECGSARIS